MKSATRARHACAFLACLVLAPAALAQSQSDGNASGGDADTASALERDVQDLKQKVLELNRELFVLEEEILFPSNTQVQFFVSLDKGNFFQLDSVQLQVDGKPVAKYLYTERELSALKRGGVHRLHVANLGTGKHEVVVHVTGKGPQGRDYRRAAQLSFDKTLGPQYVELSIQDDSASQQPTFDLRHWQ